MRVRLLSVGYISNELSNQCTVSQYACTVSKRRVRRNEISHQCTVSQYACTVIKRRVRQ